MSVGITPPHADAALGVHERPASQADIEKLEDAGLIGRGGGVALAVELNDVLGLVGDAEEREEDAA